MSTIIIALWVVLAPIVAGAGFIHEEPVDATPCAPNCALHPAPRRVIIAAH